ncbi:ATP-binding cassette domain-containing protein [Streptomyces griseobrunneus]
MITFDQVTVVYDGADEPVLRDVNLVVDEGELADVVGVVGQDPLDGFVTDTVEEELAYAMEQLAISPAVMPKRVEETLDLLGLADLRHRALYELSGGRQQRVAIGSVLTAHPRVLVLERVVQYADRVIHLPGDGRVVSGPPADIFATPSIAPPVVELGRAARWSPLSLSVRDARRAAAPLRTALAGTPAPAVRPVPEEPGATLLTARGITVAYRGVAAVREVDLDLRGGEITALMGRNGSGKSSLLWALQGSGPRRSGTVRVVSGSADGTGGPDGGAGSGASRGSGGSRGPGGSRGSRGPAKGSDPKNLSAAEARALVGLVPQTPTDLLYLESVKQELDQADIESSASDGGLTARVILDRLAPGIDGAAHPRDLSEGQKLALVLAIQLTAAPRVLLDEPTRGLDHRAKTQLISMVDELAAEGRSVVISTHDVEFAARAADRVVVMAEGDIVADGPTTEVIVASPVFAPQVAKILSPLPYLTVDQVASALPAEEVGA